MDKTFITQDEREKTTFEKKVLEVLGDGQERKHYYSGFSPHLISKKTELENIQTELHEVIREQQKWDNEMEQEKERLREKRSEFEKEEKEDQEKLKRLKQEIDRFSENAKKQYEITYAYETEYKKLDAEEKELQETNKELRDEIEDLQQYADFFDSVVMNGTMFGTSDNILSRYKALKAAKNDCSDELQAMIKTAHPENKKLKDERDQLLNEKIDLSHKVELIKDEINRLIKENRYVKMNMIKDAERVNEKESFYVTIMSSIDNITQRVLSTQNVLGRIYSTAAEGSTTVESKLELIEKRFQDLLSIVDQQAFQKLESSNSPKPKTIKKTTLKLTCAQDNKSARSGRKNLIKRVSQENDLNVNPERPTTNLRRISSRKDTSVSFE